MAQSKAFDSNAGSWPKFSGFSPLKLESKEIRLLQRDGSNGRSELRYTMRHADFTVTPFAALSYSWGAPVPDQALKHIVINGESVSIRPVLHAFLVTLAAHDPDVRLWIDAVCINQKDTDERNSQIAMMGEIFGSARKVFVWLGPGDDDTNYAFEHIQGSNLQTPFDQRQFQPAVEKLFRSSYWTRRWVIQEFALAQELFIACGPHMTSWDRVINIIDDKVLENDDQALKTMENFKGLKVLGARQNLSLLELLLRFQGSRCIDRRDKAFALRGIANDGTRLRPDYRDSITDVYFRILSLLPTEGVLPAMTGYRWPHNSATQLLDCLQVSQTDIFESMTDKPSDRLFASFECVGKVQSVEDLQERQQSSMYSKKVRLGAELERTVIGSNAIEPGDLVYSLQSSPTLPRGIYIVFSSDSQQIAATGMLLDYGDVHLSNNKELRNRLDVIGNICVGGITRCARNEPVRSQQTRVLCHINRLSLILLWLIERKEEQYVLEHYRHAPSIQRKGSEKCHCFEATGDEPATRVFASNGLASHLEVLPAFHSDASSDSTWGASRYPAWAPASTAAADRQSLRSSDLSQTGALLSSRWSSFVRDGRSDLSYAAEEGLMSWIDYIVHQNPLEVERAANDRSTPLHWAAASGNLDAVKVLLSLSQESHNARTFYGVSPLMRAINANHPEIVELLVATEKVDCISRGTSNRTPLSWAAQAGHVRPVEILLASHKVDPDAGDADGQTPLTWAAQGGHTEIVKLLLATNKVNYNKKDLSGRTPLSLAAGRGHLEVVELLLAVDGVDPNLMDSERWTPLKHAAHGRHTAIFKRLVATGRVRLNVPYADGEA